ncbi:MAG: succinylglutamate desuccinylase [Actinomyces sp.]|nr:MAG: succinylglutamate desuccinylase [Actinomyces sp.]
MDDPVIAGVRIEAGRRTDLELRPARLPSGGWMTIPVVAFRGPRPGPTVWLSAAIHGDEVCGVEIIRQVIGSLTPRKLAGTVLAVPVVNVPGFANGDRYMPDRRDLNRVFPGSRRGSLASRFAHLFMTEIVQRCDVGIDLHTGSDHRRNIPQIRADLTHEPTARLARAFAAPYTLHARLRDGSLREAARRAGAITLLYEAGEAWRFDTEAIRVGVRGVRRVLAHLGTMAFADEEDTDADSVVLESSSWVRSPQSGLARLEVDLGDRVADRQPIGVVADAVGAGARTIRANRTGVIIGRNEAPVVHRGDALVHIGSPAVSSAEPIPAREEGEP